MAGTIESRVNNSGGGTSSPLTTKGDVYTFSTVNARLGVGSNGQLLSADSTQATGLKWITASGTGTVTTVNTDSSSSSIFANTGNVIGTSTVTMTFSTQTANTVFAGPTSGSAAAPTFRSIVAGDIPTLNQNTSGTAAGLSATLAVGSGGTNSSTSLNSNRFMISSSSKIVEASAVTASRAVVSDSNGLPTASIVTTTQLAGFLNDQIDGMIASPSNVTYYIVPNAFFGFTINSINIGTTSGSCTVAINIGGSAVTGLSAISVTSSAATSSASGSNTVSTSGQVTLVVSSNSSSVNLIFSMSITRT